MRVVQSKLSESTPFKLFYQADEFLFCVSQTIIVHKTVKEFQPHTRLIRVDITGMNIYHGWLLFLVDFFYMLVNIPPREKPEKTSPTKSSGNPQ